MANEKSTGYIAVHTLQYQDADTKSTVEIKAGDAVPAAFDAKEMARLEKNGAIKKGKVVSAEATSSSDDAKIPPITGRP